MNEKTHIRQLSLIALVVLSLAMGLFATAPLSASAAADYSYDWTAAYDGSEDTASTYKIVRKPPDVNKTVDITHGSYVDCSDLIEPTGDYANISGITNVTRGGSWYNETSDWLLDGDYLDWSPSGDEPATDATYSVKYNVSYQGHIAMQAWATNKTVTVNLDNIENLTLYINETDIDLSSYASLLKTYGGDIHLKLNADTDKVNFTIHDIPEWDTILLDGSVWNSSNYTYTDGVLTFNLSMSTHDITLSYSGELSETTSTLLQDVLPLLLGLLVFLSVVGLGITGTLTRESAITLLISIVIGITVLIVISSL